MLNFIFIFIFASSAIIVFSIFWFTDEASFKKFKTILAFFSGSLVATSILLISIYFFHNIPQKNIPSAIDVYRNKTTLIINGSLHESFNDSSFFVPSDSIVVFKSLNHS